MRLLILLSILLVSCSSKPKFKMNEIVQFSSESFGATCGKVRVENYYPKTMTEDLYEVVTIEDSTCVGRFRVFESELVKLEE